MTKELKFRTYQPGLVLVFEDEKDRRAKAAICRTTTNKPNPTNAKLYRALPLDIEGELPTDGTSGASISEIPVGTYEQVKQAVTKKLTAA